jgi:hypothetical protein
LDLVKSALKRQTRRRMMMYQEFDADAAVLSAV